MVHREHVRTDTMLIDPRIARGTFFGSRISPATIDMVSKPIKP